MVILVLRTPPRLAGVLSDNNVIMVTIKLLPTGELNPSGRILRAAVHQIGSVCSKIRGSRVDEAVVLR